MAKVFPSYTPRYLLLFFLSRTRILSLAVLFNLVFVPFISQIFRNLSKSFSNSLSRPLMSKISNLRSSKIYVQTQIFARWMRFSSRFPNSKKLIRKFSKVSCSHEMDTLPDRKKKGAGSTPPRVDHADWNFGPVYVKSGATHIWPFFPGYQCTSHEPLIDRFKS